MNTTPRQAQLDLVHSIEEGARTGKGLSTFVRPVADYSRDTRICLTSVAFPPATFTQKVQRTLIAPLAKADNRQYFFPPKSVHITLQNVRTVNNPPLFTEEDIPKVQEVFQRVIPKYPPISYEFVGVMSLPTSLSLFGLADEHIQDLILELRRELTNIGLPDNKKYASDTVFFGNSTFCRYVTSPSPQFLQVAETYQNLPLGKVTVSEIHLITTNAVCYPGATKIHGSFRFSENRIKSSRRTHRANGDY